MKIEKKPKLFIPGPIHVESEILEAMGEYPIGHRTAAFSELYQEVTNGIQKVLSTKNRVFLGTCSATGLMEAAVRNSIQKRCANFVCGEFSKRWHEITRSCGIACDAFEVPLGKANTAEMVKDILKNGKHDGITVVHNESSTGLMNPISEISEVMKDFPDVAFLVDMVSSMTCVKVEVDKLGIDVALASVQKGWALPPGFAVCSVSEKVLNRSRTIANKGYYFDFGVLETFAQKFQTPYTPSLPHIYGLKIQLQRIFREGLENRFDRHTKMAEIVIKWARENFDLFPDQHYLSKTITCIKNSQNINLDELLKRLLMKGYMISGGYGPLKGKTFRIGHMGDLKPEDIQELLDVINETIREL